MAKKESKDKKPVKGLTVREIVQIDNAIDIVAELKFPMKISFQLSKTKNQIATVVKAYNKAIDALRTELRTKDAQGRYIIPDRNQKRWNEEGEALMEKTEPDLVLRTFDFNDFDFSDDDYYNDTKVPQQFITQMFPLLTD